MKEYNGGIDKDYTPEEMERFHEKLEEYDTKFLLRQKNEERIEKEWNEMSFEEKTLFSLGEGKITHVSFKEGGSIQELNTF